MKTLISSLKIASSCLVLGLGLAAFKIDSAAAQTFTRIITAGQDTYSDTNNPTMNFGGSDFLEVGNSQGNEQIAYLSWDLESLINEINSISSTAEVRNVTVSLTLTQTTDDPNNPNDNPGPRIDLGGFPLVTLDGVQVTEAFDESAAIDPNAPPTTIDDTTLFSGDINLGVNTYTGVNLDELVMDLLNTEEDLLSIALRPTEGLDFPDFNVFALESFFSQNQDDVSVRPTLEIDFELWDEGNNVDGGPNFKAQARGGDAGSNGLNGDWEFGLLTEDTNDKESVELGDQWDWQDGEAVQFTLACNQDTNEVSFTLMDDQRTAEIDFTANTCQDIEGLKIFSTARAVDAGTTMEIVVNQVQEIGGTLVNVPDFSTLATVGGSQFVEDKFYFTDSTENDGLEFTQGVELITGTITMAWQGGTDPQSPRTGSKNQIFIIPLTRLDDPTLPANVPPSEIESVPEPTSVVGLIMLGTTAIGLRLRGRKSED
ncbi:MAG: choice-of-anchor W domain-containing protein [Crocosphaera sp.]